MAILMPVFSMFNLVAGLSHSIFYFCLYLFDHFTNHNFNLITVQVNIMRQEVSDLDKKMENRHTDVTDKDLVLSLNQLDTSQPVTMFGYLFKRTTNAFKSWNRRYFTLQNNQLVYRKRSGKKAQ